MKFQILGIFLLLVLLTGINAAPDKYEILSDNKANVCPFGGTLSEAECKIAFKYVTKGKDVDSATWTGSAGYAPPGCSYYLEGGTRYKRIYNKLSTGKNGGAFPLICKSKPK